MRFAGNDGFGTNLQIDRDGTGTAYGWTTVLYVANVNDPAEFTAANYRYTVLTA